jgi:Flp pilus assembly protein TadD
MVGVVHNLREKNEAAETFFEAATSYQPNSILAWTMLGLHYDGIGNEIRAEMAISEANKLNIANAIALARSLQQDQADGLSLDGVDLELQADSIAVQDNQKGTPVSMGGSDRTDKGAKTSAKSDRRGSARKSVVKIQNRSTSVKSGHPDEEEIASALTGRECIQAIPAETIYMQAASFCLEVKALTFSERSLAKHLLEPLGGQSCSYYIAMAKLHLQKGQMEEAEEALKEAVQFDHQNPDVWALTGHVKYLVGDIETAKDCYERTTAFVSDAGEMHSIYLRLASIYLQEKQYAKAKTTFLIACKKTPSCLSWLGVGIACYRLDDLAESEDALSEANVLNNSDPEVWAYLSLVCLRTGRRLEAEQAYKYALKLNLEDENLMKEINNLQNQVGFGNPQF